MAVEVSGFRGGAFRVVGISSIGWGQVTNPDPCYKVIVSRNRCKTFDTYKTRCRSLMKPFKILRNLARRASQLVQEALKPKPT